MCELEVASPVRCAAEGRGGPACDGACVFAEAQVGRFELQAGAGRRSRPLERLVRPDEGADAECVGAAEANGREHPSDELRPRADVVLGGWAVGSVEAVAAAVVVVVGRGAGLVVGKTGVAN